MCLVARDDMESCIAMPLMIQPGPSAILQYSRCKRSLQKFNTICMKVHTNLACTQLLYFLVVGCFNDLFSTCFNCVLRLKSTFLTKGIFLIVSLHFFCYSSSLTLVCFNLAQKFAPGIFCFIYDMMLIHLIGYLK